MTNVDIILAGILLTGIILGYMAGAVHMLCITGGLIAGILFCFEKEGILLRYCRFDLHLSLQASYYVVYGIILSLGVGLGLLLAWFITKVLKWIWLNWANKLTGAFLGMAFTALFQCIGLNLLMIFPQQKPLISEKIQQESILVKPISGVFKQNFTLSQ